MAWVGIHYVAQCVGYERGKEGTKKLDFNFT